MPRTPHRHDLKRLTWASAVIGAAIIIGSMAVALHIVAGGKQRAMADRANRLIDLVAVRLSTTTALASSAAAFFEASEAVAPEEFTTFGRSVVGASPQVLVIGYAPRVRADERAAFELRHSRPGRPYRVTDYGAAGSVETAPARDEYFPSLYALTPASTEPLRPGFDMLQRCPAEMALVRRFGRTQLRQIPTEDFGHFNFMLLAPVQTPGAPARTAGVVFLVTNLDVLVARQENAVPGGTLTIQLNDGPPHRLPMAPPAAAAPLLARPLLRLPDGGERRDSAQGEQHLGVALDYPVALTLADLLPLLGVLLATTGFCIGSYRLVQLQLLASHAEGANRAKSQFLATMSHEIRTPLNGVLGMADLLARTPLNHEQQHYADTIRSSGDNLLAIVNDVLDVSKIEAGQMVLEATPFEIAQIVADVADLYRIGLYNRGIAFAASVASDVPDWLVGDPTRIRQIVMNLLGNAVKFTERGEIEVRVRALQTTDDHCRLRVSVRDTGRGIPQKAQARLFQAFSQETASTARLYGGTGLGLKICRDLVALMGGDIGVDSQPGAGSTFWFELTLPRTAPVAAPAPLELRAVLVVDDYAATRTILLEQLRHLGIAAAATANVREAWQYLENHQHDLPELIITDLNMPGENGDAFAQRLAADPRFAALPVVLLTASSGLALHDGMPPNLKYCGGKPTSPSQLRGVLLQTLNRIDAAPRPPAAIAEFLRPLRVLAAEDNAVNASVLKGMLEKLGHRAVFCKDGAAAVVAFAKASPRFDVVLLDYQMPVMDGLEACRRIRAIERQEQLPHTPVIALTAHAFEDQRQQCLAAGMDNYLSKPIALAALGAALRPYQLLPARNHACDPSARG